MHSKNIKKYLKSVMTTALAMLLCTAASGQSWVTLHKPARSLVTPEKLEREISFLSDPVCQGRRTGTRGNVEAAAWVSRRFNDAGLIPLGDSWSKTVKAEDGTPCHNIMGFMSGSIKKAHPTQYVIVGAHYDHLGILEGKLYPGADSNASGVAALTSLADMFTMTRSIGISFNCNLIFVAFDGKEKGLAGSCGLWEMIRDGKLKDPVNGTVISKDKIAMVVNIDQIGSTLSPLNKNREDYIIMLGGHSITKSDMYMLETCNRNYDLNMDVGLSYYGSANFTKLFYRMSDQRVFVDNRIPSVMFTSGITMNNNKTWDETSTLDMEVLQKRIYLIYHWIDKIL